MVRLILSDIDGTLVPYGRSAVPEALFPLVERLGEKGVLFCPASGRQYHSLRRLFAPVADRVCFLCENGAVLFGPGREESAPVLSKTVMPRLDAEELARAIDGLEDADVLISGENTSYICSCGPGLERDLAGRLGNRVVRVGDPGCIGEEIIKVSAFCPKGLEGPAAALGPRWGEAYHMAAAGPDWLDFTLADKGVGLRGLCAALGVALEEVAAFGDNWNDLPMLELAGRAWVMEGADPALKEKIPNHCGDVLSVMEELLREVEG